MRIKMTENEIYDVIVNRGIVFVLTDIDQDLTVNGEKGAIYEEDDSMANLGFSELIGEKRIYAFGYEAVKEFLID